MSSLTSLVTRGHLGGPIGPLRIVAQHEAIVLHRRAAARGIDDDRVEAAVRRRSRSRPPRWPWRSRGQTAGHSPCRGGGSARRSSPHHRAITTSTPWRVSRRIVASLICGASTCWAQPVISAARARRGPSAGNTWGRSTGSAPGDQRPAPGRAWRRAGRAADRAKGRPNQAPIEGQAKAPGIGQHPGEDSYATQRSRNGALGRSPRCALPGVVDQMHVVDARGAGGHAGQAGEAAVDVLDQPRSGRRAVVLQHVLDEIDAAARAVELVAQQN